MLELNSDILDASKKVVLGSLSAGKQTEESRVMWAEVLQDLARFMELRSKVLAGRPISKIPQRVKIVWPPPGLQDDRGAPPVVMWCTKINDKQTQPADQGRKKPRHQMEESVGTGSASCSSSASSWSTWWGR